ncbi:MAG: hypothetical protein JWO53_492, partial [Chlamydiia bacterium]|nr:hypothetical protein [Chlamydiia bacterium]
MEPTRPYLQLNSPHYLLNAQKGSNLILAPSTSSTTLFSLATDIYHTAFRLFAQPLAFIHTPSPYEKFEKVDLKKHKHLLSALLSTLFFQEGSFDFRKLPNSLRKEVLELAEQVDECSLENTAIQWQDIYSLSSCFPLLKKLTINGETLENRDLNCLTSFRQLQQIKIINGRKITSSGLLNFANISTLKTITIYGSQCATRKGYRFPTKETYQVINQLLFTHLSLEKIAFDDYESCMLKPTAHELTSLLKDPACAHTIAIDFDYGCHKLNRDVLQNIAFYLPKLQRLAIGGCHSIQDNDLQYLRYFPSLKQLELYG